MSYRISVPRRTDLDLTRQQRRHHHRDVNGTIRFDTTNGGVRSPASAATCAARRATAASPCSSTDSAGTAPASTSRRPTAASRLTIPDGYNADLTTGTVNGGFRTDVPMTVQGELSPRRGLSTTLGSGGAPVSVRTTNGGLESTADSRIRR